MRNFCTFSDSTAACSCRSDSKSGNPGFSVQEQNLHSSPMQQKIVTSLQVVPSKAIVMSRILSEPVKIFLTLPEVQVSASVKTFSVIYFQKAESVCTCLEKGQLTELNMKIINQKQQLCHRLLVSAVEMHYIKSTFGCGISMHSSVFGSELIRKVQNARH